MSNKRKFVGPIVGAAISLAFLALALRNVNANDIVAALSTADYRLVLLSGIFTVFSYVFRTARWARLLRPQKRIPVRRLFPVLVVGFALNNLLPGRPGEVARAVSLGQREGLSKTLGLATIVVERVADGIVLVVVLLLVSLFIDLPGWGRQAEFVSSAIFALALAVLVLLLWQQPLAARLLSFVLRFLPPKPAAAVDRMFRSFILGLHSLRSRANAAAIALLSIVVWACEATHYFFILSAFGLIDPLPMRALAALLLMAIVNLSVAIPAAPGGVGPFDWAGTLALGTLGIASGPALSAVLTAHAVQYVLVTGIGIVLGAREGVRLAKPVGQTEGN